MEKKGMETGVAEIARYIEEMEVRKKAIGGWDEESVMEHIRTICVKYEAVIRSLTGRIREKEQETETLKSEYGKKSTDLLDSMAQIRIYAEQEKQKAEEEAERTLEEAREEAERILAETREEAEQRLGEARERAEKEEDRIRSLQTTYMRSLEEYRKKKEAFRQEGSLFCKNVRDILEQIEALGDGQEETEESQTQETAKEAGTHPGREGDPEPY